MRPYTYPTAPTYETTEHLRARNDREIGRALTLVDSSNIRIAVITPPSSTPPNAFAASHLEYRLHDLYDAIDEIQNLLLLGLRLLVVITKVPYIS